MKAITVLASRTRRSSLARSVRIGRKQNRMSRCNEYNNNIISYDMIWYNLIVRLRALTRIRISSLQFESDAFPHAGTLRITFTSTCNAYHHILLYIIFVSSRFFRYRVTDVARNLYNNNMRSYRHETTIARR